MAKNGEILQHTSKQNSPFAAESGFLKWNHKYSQIYSGADPTFIEGDIFKTIIPLVSKATDQATEQVTEQAAEQAAEQVNEGIKKLLEFCQVPRTRSEMQEFMKLHHREHFRTKILNPLIKGGLLKLSIPYKPRSPKQKYYYENR